MIHHISLVVCPGMAQPIALYHPVYSFNKYINVKKTLLFSFFEELPLS
ncbi:MAG: hypothetical protein HNEKOMLI_00545 [Sodalis sp. Psp]|nr:hypothetical protein [Sodalis sp. Psp]MCR3757017.1 hypothetical protein [Sodalis sp. Ppy]